MDIKGSLGRRDTPSETGDVFSPSSITMLSTSITGGLDLNDEMSRQSDKKKVKRSKWHLGIRSRSDPADIMSEVFAALKNLNMEWRTLDSPFHLKVRHQQHLERPVTSPPLPILLPFIFSEVVAYLCVTVCIFQVVLSLQLYRVDEKNFLLDFVNMDNKSSASTFDFFSVCSRLITELAISG